MWLFPPLEPVDPPFPSHSRLERGGLIFPCVSLPMQGSQRTRLPAPCPMGAAAASPSPRLLPALPFPLLGRKDQALTPEPGMGMAHSRAPRLLGKRGNSFKSLLPFPLSPRFRSHCFQRGTGMQIQR